MLLHLSVVRVLVPVTLLFPDFSEVLRNWRIVCQWAARVAKSLDCSYSEERVRELTALPTSGRRGVVHH